MLTQKRYLAAFLILSAAFNVLFWQEKLGINALIFSGIMILSVMLLKPKAIRSRNVWGTALLAFFTADLVLIHNSGLAKFMHFISLILFVGFVHQPQLRTVFLALGAVFENVANLLRRLSIQLPLWAMFHPWLRKSWNVMRISLIPLGLLLVFFIIFLIANPRFEDFSTHGLGWAFSHVNAFLENISGERIAFIILGFLIAGWVVFSQTSNGWLKLERGHPDNLQRTRQRPNPQAPRLGLKREYIIALLSMGMINVLLLVNNLIDIDWIWVGFEYQGEFNLSQFVHTGTYMLIFSILLSMGIMLYFFRANLNFYPKNTWLKRLSYLWIGQNVILAISVALRNYHYISNCGLTFKRIGVMVFLVMTLYGLYALFLKIRNRKSLFYLLRTNSWAVYLILIGLAVVDWNPIIARYNLSHYAQARPEYIDLNYVLSLSDSAIPTMMEYRTVFSNATNPKITSVPFFERKLNEKIKHFKETQASLSWCSWNVADHRTSDFIASQWQLSAP